MVTPDVSEVSDSNVRRGGRHFTVVELRLNGDGEGEGKMSIAAKISGNNVLNLIELEDYASQPVRLLAVLSDRRPT